jgi:hypothetical protein
MFTGDDNADVLDNDMKSIISMKLRKEKYI